MKSMKLIFIAIFAMLVFNGCDELIKKDVELPITFTVTERIAIPEDYDPKAENKFAAGGTYDILSHCQTQDEILNCYFHFSEHRIVVR